MTTFLKLTQEIAKKIFLRSSKPVWIQRTLLNAEAAERHLQVCAFGAWLEKQTWEDRRLAKEAVKEKQV